MYWNHNCKICRVYTYRLIETWDVLKYEQSAVWAFRIWWLIETWDVLKLTDLIQKCTDLAKINRNMRCIEIIFFLPAYIDKYRLIETWDVLK